VCCSGICCYNNNNNNNNNSILYYFYAESKATRPITETAQCRITLWTDNVKTRDKLQANTGERKHINAENVNKQKQKEETYNNNNTK
jgi:hypothetical protein